MNEFKETKTSVANIIPQQWFKKPEESSVWMSAFRTLLVDKKQFTGATIHDYDQIRILILFGTLDYLDSGQIKVEIDQNGMLKFSGQPKMAKTPESAWLVILQPFKIDGVEQNEYNIRTKAGSYASIYTAINGRNMAFELVFENTIFIANGNISAATDSVINPHSFPKPDVSKRQLDFIYHVGKQIEKSERNKKRRIEISLHWFNEGMRSKGLDEFIKHWVALETLGMPDTTNVKPLNEAIAKSYGISTSESSTKFGIGKIFGLRSRIIHNGEDLPIHQMLSEYLQCIYVDVLFELLGLKSQKRAIKIIDNPEFDLDKLLYI